jgi:hypothetical protein
MILYVIRFVCVEHALVVRAGVVVTVVPKIKGKDWYSGHLNPLVQIYRYCQCYCLRKPEFNTDKPNHIKYHLVHHQNQFVLPNFNNGDMH